MTKKTIKRAIKRAIKKEDKIAILKKGEKRDTKTQNISIKMGQKFD